MWLGIFGLALIFIGLIIALIKKKNATNANEYQHKKNDDKQPKTSAASQDSMRKTSEDQIINQSKGKKGKGKKQTDPSLDIVDKEFVGIIKAPGISAIDIKHSKMLVSTTNNQLQLYDLKEYKKDNPTACKKGYQLLQNRGTAVFIGTNYLYVALEGDKTVVIYEFVGQNGVYFKLVSKLPKGIHNSQILSVYSDQKQQFILTVGSEADTTLKVFNHKGQKLHEVNTSQVQHYGAKLVEDLLCLRTWTPSYKLFRISSDKKSFSFTTIDKSIELSHQDGVLDGAIDTLGNNGVTIRKDHSICVWKLDFNLKNSTKKKETNQIGKLLKCGLCQIHSIQTQQGRLKTILLFSDDRSLYLTDLDLNVKHTFGLPERQKDNIGSIKLAGKKNLIVCGITNQSGRIYMWNGTQILNSTEKYEY